ncbi:MAG: pyridoxamine 5'-phosphate oxidase family protein [Rhodobacteraceae bacterium]|nr:pyridoxamine 5'-phosphate oxidase family protein [Paracoccaceae bacterium]
MPNAYRDIAFTPAVEAAQTAQGSRELNARQQAQPGRSNTALTGDEAAFLAQRDSFYMASVGETGWPYLQHRGGPAGFVKVLDAQTLGFADFAGNRQYVSLGNLAGDDRVSLFFMDYLNRARLKMFGRASTIGPDDPRLDALSVDGYRARIERGFVIHVEGFDWNCPQHITQRFTLDEVEQATAKMMARIAELEAELAALKSGQSG